MRKLLLLGTVVGLMLSLMACASLSLSKVRQDTIVLRDRPHISNFYVDRYGPGTMLLLASRLQVPMAIWEASDAMSSTLIYCSGMEKEDPVLKDLQVGKIYRIDFNLIRQSNEVYSDIEGGYTSVIIVNCLNITPVSK